MITPSITTRANQLLQQLRECKSPDLTVLERLLKEIMNLRARDTANDLLEALKALKLARELMPIPSSESVAEFESAEKQALWHIDVRRILDKYPNLK